VIKDLFRFEEADDPQVEDDAWVLKSDENIGIQVCEDGTFRITKFVEKEGCFYHSDNHKHLLDAMKEAVEMQGQLDVVGVLAEGGE
tara:strand:+ start:55 stop:312 length:258 start_codon:yes stop_codon:yes gene_type:complete